MLARDMNRSFGKVLDLFLGQYRIGHFTPWRIIDDVLSRPANILISYEIKGISNTPVAGSRY